MPCIYLTENLFNKQHGILPWRYIGSDQHDRSEYLGSSKKLKEDIKTLGKENFVKNVIDYYDNIDNKELRKIEAVKYLKPNQVRSDPSYYNETDYYSPGCGKKGMKHSKPRSEIHIQRIIEHRTGSTKNAVSRELMRNKKIGTKASADTKALMSAQRRGALNTNALYWTVIDPAGNTHNVCGLRFWVNTNRLNFNEVYYSKNSWKTTKHGTGKGGGRKKKGSVQL